MALLERVGMLLRANLNDMIDRAEDPSKMVKQVILDMENQLMQVKTQVAISLADLHLLERKALDNAQKRDEYHRKAELALAKGDEGLARAALERSIDGGKLADSFGEQILDQKTQVESLKTALRSLESKLSEARGKSELLMARHRRARAAERAVTAGGESAGWERLNEKVNRAEAVAQARTELMGENVDDRFRALEKRDEVERLLMALKMKALT